MSWFRSKLLSLLAVGELLIRTESGFDGAEISTLTPAGPWVPDANNTRDLGLTGTRWRTLYLGTSLDAPKWAYAGDTEVDLSGAATRTLTVRNSTVAQVANIDLDGTYYFRNGTAFTIRLSGTPTANRVFTFPDVADDTVAVLGAAQTWTGVQTFSAAPRVGSIADTGGNASIMLVATALAVNSLNVVNSATGQPIELYPAGTDTNTGLAISAKGNASLMLRGGGGGTKVAVNDTGIGLHGAAPVAQGAHIPDATDAPSAVTQLNLLLAYLRTRGDLASS